MYRITRHAVLAPLLALGLLPLSANATAQGASEDMTNPSGDPYGEGVQTFYLTFDGTAYDGDMLVIGSRGFRLDANDEVLEGRYHAFGKFILFWDPEQGNYALASVEKTEDGTWNSCWGTTIGSVLRCEDPAVSATIQTEEPPMGMETPADGDVPATPDEPTDPMMPTGEPVDTPDPEPTSEPIESEPVAMPEAPAEPTLDEPMEPEPVDEPMDPETTKPVPVDEPTEAPAPEPVAMPEPELPGTPEIDEPTSEEPTGEEPAEDMAEEPTSEEPTAEEPAEDMAEAPTSEEPTGEEPAEDMAEEPTSEEPASEEPTEEMTEDDSEEPTDPDEARVAGADPSQVGCETSSLEDFEAAMLAYTNSLRAEARVCPANDDGSKPAKSFDAAPALTWSDQLATAARAHSQDQADIDLQTHVGSDGLSLGDRATNAGYEWSGLAENISPSQGNVVEVHEGFINPDGTDVPTGWINSPGHCDNIMNPDLEEMGAACVEQPGDDEDHRWTVKFGSPR